MGSDNIWVFDVAQAKLVSYHLILSQPWSKFTISDAFYSCCEPNSQKYIFDPSKIDLIINTTKCVAEETVLLDTKLNELIYVADYFPLGNGRIKNSKRKIQLM